MRSQEIPGRWLGPTFLPIVVSPLVAAPGALTVSLHFEPQESGEEVIKAALAKGAEDRGAGFAVRRGV